MRCCGLAMLLGVVLHATVCYMPHDMPDLVWAAHDRATSPVFDWLFWGIHSFRLPLFFVLAGFFAVVLYEKRGPWGFLTHGTCRLLLPFLGAGLILLPLTFAVWSLGWLRAGQCTLHDLRRMKFAPTLQANLYGPAHLWFLEDLYLICLLFGVFRRLLACCQVEWPRWRHWLDRLPGSPWFPVLWAVPTGVIVVLAPEAVYHFRNSFCPDPCAWPITAVSFLPEPGWHAAARSWTTASFPGTPAACGSVCRCFWATDCSCKAISRAG